MAASAVVAPMLFLGNASGADFTFHIASWMDAAHQWHEGILYPRWAEWANWGYGEPRFVFYPPLSWMLGAALGSILPWVAAPVAFIWIALTAAGLAMWRFAREWLSPAESLAAAVFYAANPYQLVIVYYRSDFAELLAWAFLPLLLLETVRVMRGAGFGSARDAIGSGWTASSGTMSRFALVFAAIWLSNAPAAVIATYSVALLLLVGSMIARHPRPLLRGLISMAAGFGLAAFYIVPAARERPWVQTSRLISGSFHPLQNFLFCRSSDPEFLLFNWKVSGVAMAMLLTFGVCAVFSGRRLKLLRDIWPLLLVLSTATVVFLFPISAWAWRHLPELQYVQFPWRWLGVLGIAFALCSAAVFSPGRRRTATWALTAAIIFGTGTLIVRDAWWDNADVTDMGEALRSGHGYTGVDEYSPLGCDRDWSDQVAMGCVPEPDGSAARLARLESRTGELIPVSDEDGVSGAVSVASGDLAAPQIRITRWTAEERFFSEKGGAPVTLAIRALRYPAWAATVDGHPARLQTSAQFGQLLLSFSPGTHRVQIRLRRTPDRLLGDAVSLIFSVGLLLAAGAAQFRRREAAIRAKRARERAR